MGFVQVEVTHAHSHAQTQTRSSRKLFFCVLNARHRLTSDIFQELIQSLKEVKLGHYLSLCFNQRGSSAFNILIFIMVFCSVHEIGQNEDFGTDSSRVARAEFAASFLCTVASGGSGRWEDEGSSSWIHHMSLSLHVWAQWGKDGGFPTPEFTCFPPPNIPNFFSFLHKMLYCPT